MMKAVHCCVIELKRISIDDIHLDESLAPGKWKEISDVWREPVSRPGGDAGSYGA